jgi:L-histidine Nalpha-methyltransferase
MITAEITTLFAKDTLKGLTAENKFLLPKYFYDKTGSEIFRKIMHMPEYYLTDCEYEIFNLQSEEICRRLKQISQPFELIELGAGDGLKSKLLLRSLLEDKIRFNYIPVDISTHALEVFRKELTQDFPGLIVNGYSGDYFTAMKNFNGHAHGRVVLFLGSNIGNFMEDEMNRFMMLLKNMTTKGDRALIGFDLKKSPETIIKAYDDPHGHTRDFNLNHLHRINTELDANFNVDRFRHHTCYEPGTGAMKSFLISLTPQKVTLGALDTVIDFDKWEPIFMEQSLKFSLQDIDKLASRYGFSIEHNFTDSKGYFTDSIWVRQ